MSQDKVYLERLHNKNKTYQRVPENLYNETLIAFRDIEDKLMLGFASRFGLGFFYCPILHSVNPIAGRESL